MRVPATGGLTHAEDGVVLPDGRLLVGDWNHGLVTIDQDGAIRPFGDFAAAGFRTKPDPLWNSPNGISWEPDGRHVLVADITGGHLYRVDTRTEEVRLLYDHPFGINAAVRDPSGAIWFTQSTENPAGAGSEARMFAAADRPMGDGSVWRIAPDDTGLPEPSATKVVEGLHFANGIVFDKPRGRLYVAEIVASNILSFAVDPVTGALGDRRVLARVTTPDNLELAADGMLWAASPFANALYVVDPDTGEVSKAFDPDPAKSARMVAELERRQAVGEPVLPLLGPDLWAPLPGLVTGVILSPNGEGPIHVSGLGDALVRLESEPTKPAQKGASADFARRYAAAWSSRKPGGVASFYAADGSLAVNGGDPAIGRAAIAEVARGFMEAFPDLVVALDGLEQEGDRLLFRWTLTGTHAGSGAAVRIDGTEAWLLSGDGMIVDSIGSFDGADYERQLVPPGPDDLERVLEHRDNAILAGIRSGGIAGIMDLYAPDALYSPSADSLLEGASAIEEFWKEIVASPAHDAAIEPLRIERLANDAFVEVQTYDVFDNTGKRLFGGHAALLWRRVDGAWRIASDVSN